MAVKVGQDPVESDRFTRHGADGKYLASVLLDLDDWALMPV